MKTIDSLPRLVVIDDNQDFLDQLRDQGLEQYFVTDLISIKNVSDGSPGLDRIVQRVGDFLPDHLLLDINLQRPGDSQLILQRLGERQALSDQCRIWLISQAFQPKTAEDMLHPFQGIDANVQNIVLPKPISIRRLWAELTDQALYEPHPQWQNFPLPLRILSQTGKVLHTNQHWWRPEYPDPSEFFQQERRIPCKEFTGSYRGEKKSGFSVHTFPLEQEGQRFLAQVVEIYPLEPVVTSLKRTLDKVFHTMELAGYRGRFYRLRPLANHKDEKVYNQVLELASLSYQADLSLPYRMPLKGWLKTRLNEYKFDPKGSLAYRIRTSNDEPKDDPSLHELKKRLDLIDLKSSLEMPVWVRRRDSTKESAVTTDEPSHEIAAWLIFDRHHRSNPSSSGAVGDEVDEQSVQPLLPLLGSLVALVAAAIRRERLQELADYEARMRQLDQQLAEKEITNEQRLNALLDALCDLSGAASGVLRVKDDNDRCLKIAALRVGDRLRFLQGIRIPLEADYHPIVKAWHRREPFACQDFGSGRPKEELMEALQEARDPHLQALSHEDLQEYIRWVDEDIKALLAIPILLPPDTKIGAITLQFAQPFSITQRHKEQIDAVLQRARWLIQQYQDKKKSGNVASNAEP